MNSRIVYRSALVPLVMLAACQDQGLVGPAASPPEEAPRFTVERSTTILGTLSASGPSHGYGINSSGIVVGLDAGGGYGFRAAVGAPLDSVAPGFMTTAYAINGTGVITGQATFPGVGSPRAFRLAPGGEIENLGTIPGAAADAQSDGRAINSAGVITGGAQGATYERAFRAAPGGSMQDLGTIGGDGASRGLGINDAGIVVGWADSSETVRHAFRIQPGGPVEDLSPWIGSSAHSVAQAINPSGVIVGWKAGGPGGVFSAFRLVPGQPVEWLGMGGDRSWAYAVNSHGDAAGQARDEYGSYHAVVWMASGTVVDLGIGIATGINDARQVSGSAMTLHGTRAVRWSLVPGPPIFFAPVAATATSPTSALVAWADSSDDESHFEVARRTKAPGGSYGGYTSLGNRPAGDTVMADGGLVMGNTYQYRVRACNGFGCSAWVLSPGLVMASIPAAPGAPAGTIVSANRIQVRWGDHSSNESRFEVARRQWSGTWSSFTALPNPAANATGYADMGVTTTNTYQYRARSCSAAGCSAWVLGAAVVLPTTPGNMTATASLPTRINLHWSDYSNNETTFEVARRLRNLDGSWGPFAPFAPLGANVSGHVDNGALAGRTYGYRVRACNASGCSAWAMSPSATTPTS